MLGYTAEKLQMYHDCNLPRCCTFLQFLGTWTVNFFINPAAGRGTGVHLEGWISLTAFPPEQNEIVLPFLSLLLTFYTEAFIQGSV